MRKLGLLINGLLLAVLLNPVLANAEGNVYLGLGLNALALDNERIFDVPTSSPGHAPKEVSGILGYQFNELWATDLTFGTDVSGEVSADQLILNGYRFFGSNEWKPFISAGFSSFGVDEAPDDRTQQIQAGIGVSGALSDSIEFRANYQFFGGLGGESNLDRGFGLSLNWHLGKTGKSVASAAITPKPIPEPESVPEKKVVVDTYKIMVEFDFDKSDIRAVYEPQFKEIAQVLTDSPEITMTIEGHTDWIGSDDYNLSLSESRAEAVKNKFLNDYSITADRIEIIGYGETRPIADNNTAAGRQQNRRAVSVILKPRN